MKRFFNGPSRVLMAICLMFSVQAIADEAMTTPGVSFLTGGVGEEEWTAMQERANDYNLRLLFAQKTTGAYLAGVKVTVENEKGQRILDANDCGPRFFTNLPAGQYRLMVEYAGEQQKRMVSVAKAYATNLYFYFP